MTADFQSFGFPPGYFVIRSVANNRLFDIEADEVEGLYSVLSVQAPRYLTPELEDGTNIVLWPSKEYSLVESAIVLSSTICYELTSRALSQI
jgi:WD repeat-containing protein 23